MRTFIVGATGVLGRALLPLLLQKGYIVRALARTPEKARALELAGVEAMEGDLLAPETVVHIVDMAQAIVRALEEPLVVATFNIVDEPIRNGDYLDHLADILGVPHPPRDLARPCPPSYRCSNRAAHNVLGWRPVHGIWPDPEQYTPFWKEPPMQKQDIEKSAQQNNW